MPILVMRRDTADGPQVRTDQVRGMLGLSDRGAMRRLFAHLIAGDADAMLADLDAQHSLGVDPLAVVRGLLAMVHAITLHKASGRVRTVHGEEDRAALAEWAGKLGNARLHRLWQLLLKGHDEIEVAPIPREACEMALLRVLYASTLPDPGTLARRLNDAPAAPEPRPAGTPFRAHPCRLTCARQFAAMGNGRARRPHPQPRALATIADIVDLLDSGGRLLLAGQVKARHAADRNRRGPADLSVGQRPRRLCAAAARGAGGHHRASLDGGTRRGRCDAQPCRAGKAARSGDARRNSEPSVGEGDAGGVSRCGYRPKIHWTAADPSPHDGDTLPTRSAKA